ncbi:Hint domain-containing protein [Methylobacterium organophilum]|uniref:Peptidase metallopeptidase domain-containing protein n=1 Tax=Methylobacterium organophilum TaxID=410 RepID=A0ABQ4T739_METOR|nr:Hint domain-containing protein [Methylobacterium organophilum]GJE26035.1 hypothetical protein LKMONMHP_0879 [Methylobacterium organophilum]
MATDYMLEGPKWGGSADGTPGGTVTYAFDSSVPTTFYNDIRTSLGNWSSYGNIQFQQAGSTSDADIVFHEAPLTAANGSPDGPGNTLGITNYSYYTSGSVSGTFVPGVTVTFDSAEGWTLSGDGHVTSANGVRLDLLSTHEVGHAIGLDHYDATPAVMNSVYSGTGLTSSDIHGVQALYGASVLCFVGGTAIRTARGAVAVEDLRVGDRAVTASGALRRVTWIGHRTIHCRMQVVPSESWPVRIRRDAFGPGLPVKDLFLSPGHPVLVGQDADGEGGVLVPVMSLINGTTIARTRRDRVTYWHVALEEHDILLAEGLPAESFFDLGQRAWFTGHEEGGLLDPDMALVGGSRCRPVAVDGPLVEAERRRLDAVFAESLAAHCGWPSEGALWRAA